MPVVKNLFGVQVKGAYGDKFWAQLGFQSNSVFNIGLGYTLSNLGLGYNYSTENSLMKEHSSGMHEIIFCINIKNSPLKKKSRRIRPDFEDGNSTTPAAPKN